MEETGRDSRGLNNNVWQNLHSVALQLKPLEEQPLEAYRDWVNEGGSLEVVHPSQYDVGCILLVSQDRQKVTVKGSRPDRTGMWIDVAHTPYHTFLQLGWGEPKMRYRRVTHATQETRRAR
jgi:hypothetical protein